MKKLQFWFSIVFVALVLGLSIFRGLACADEVSISDQLKKIPTLHQSILFNLTDSKLDYASSVTIVKLFDKISLDLGWSPKQELLGLASLKLVEVKNYLDYPILNWVVIEPFVSYGFDRIENFKELGQGNLSVGSKILSVKF